jgi:hypothetical protein
MHWLVETLRQHPEVALFLVLKRMYVQHSGNAFVSQEEVLIRCE